MAEAKPEPGNPLNMLIGFIAFLVLAVVLWYAAGGPSRADLGGILLHAPEPLDTGTAYGPNPDNTGGSYYQDQTVPAPAAFSTSTTN